MFLFPVRKLATEQIGPLVKKMEEEHKIDDNIRQLLFDNGVNIFINMFIQRDINVNIINILRKLFAIFYSR